MIWCLLYKSHHRTKLAKKWYAYYRILRKHGDLTFTFQYVWTGIEKKEVHANDILYPTDIDERESTNNKGSILELSVTSTDSEDQPSAKLKKCQNLKLHTLDSYTENMPLAKVKQRLQQAASITSKDNSDSDDLLIEVQKGTRANKPKESYTRTYTDYMPLAKLRRKLNKKNK